MDDLRWMDLAEEAGQLREAMVSRAAIEQAKGVLATLRGCSVDEAFDALRQASMHHNVKIRDLCGVLVAAVGQQDDHLDGSPSDDAVRAAVVRSFGEDLVRLRAGGRPITPRKIDVRPSADGRTIDT